MEGGSPLSHNATAKSTPEPYKPMVSDETTELIYYVNYICISAFVSSFSVCGNFLTITTFFKMGFKDTINISLANFVIWDLFRAILMLITRFHGIIHYFDTVLEFSWINVTSYYFAYMWSTCGYISGNLAGYIAVERCICVSFPFTVKHLLTRRFVLGVNIAITLTVFSSFMPYFPNMRIAYLVHPVFNQTVAVFQVKDIGSIYDDYLNMISMLWLVIPFSIICVCTLVISYHLRKFSKFRAQMKVTGKTSGDSSKGGGGGGMKSRDQKVMKMLLVIILVFLITTIPRMTMYFIRYNFPEIDFGRKEFNMFKILVSLKSVFDSLNTFANPFIFFFMSVQYREMFIKLFKPKCL